MKQKELVKMVVDKTGRQLFTQARLYDLLNGKGIRNKLAEVHAINQILGIPEFSAAFLDVKERSEDDES